MDIEIEKYKGFGITYNDQNDKFECEIEMNNAVKSAKRSSLKAVRKEIDLFIKANAEFKPFSFFKKLSYTNNVNHIKCIGIRTDGRFVLQGEYRKEYCSIEDMRAFVYDADIENALKQVEDEFEAAKDRRDSLRNEILLSLVKMDLSQYDLNNTDDAN